jgi:hypothetical protein
MLIQSVNGEGRGINVCWKNNASTCWWCRPTPPIRARSSLAPANTGLEWCKYEYPDQPELRFAALLKAIDAAGDLAELYERWRRRIQENR